MHYCAKSITLNNKVLNNVMRNKIIHMCTIYLLVVKCKYYYDQIKDIILYCLYYINNNNIN